MNYRLLPLLLLLSLPAVGQETPKKIMRAGIIGLDTSHAIAFTTTLNVKKPAETADFRVVAAYPQGSRDIESSTKRVPEYTAKVKTMGVEIVDSIEKLTSMVDCVFLESNDGRVHLEQALEVIKSRKPLFIDKPLAASLKDVLAIVKAAEERKVPFFCSSALRYGKSTQAVANGSLGKVMKAETFSPATQEKTHPDLYWYGVHGCESLSTVMGLGCVSVERGTTEDGKIMVTGQWPDGRIGIYRESNSADRKGYGGKATGEKGELAIGAYESYDPLLLQICEFFRTEKPPVSSQAMIELYALMEAADVSKARGGKPVTLLEVLLKAEQ
jgi:predicted dehydrogenase